LAQQFLADAQSTGAGSGRGMVNPPLQRPDASQGGAWSGVKQGAKDTLTGPAQLLYNALPASVQKAGDAVDNWLFQKTGGAIGAAPGGFNSAVSGENAAYEANRQAAGREGFDWARTAGNVAGSLPLAIATSGQSAPATMGAAVGRGALAGAATGAAQPVTSGDFWSEKAKQTALGGAAGGAGTALARGVAAVASPVIDKAQKALIDAGMTLTPGQLLGGGLKTAEEKLASVPVLGSFIKGAQNRTTEDLNRVAYARVLAPLESAGIKTQMPSEVGRAGIDEITQQVKSAYNNEVLPKLSLTVDGRLAQELAQLKSMASQGLEPTQAQRFASLLSDKVEKNIATGGASGKTLQGMMSDLGQLASGYKSDPSFANRQLGDALLSVEQSIKGAVGRTDPAQAALLSKVDESFANLARVQSAGAMQGAPGGVFSAAQLSSAVKGGDKTVRDNAFARGQAFMQDLSDPAKEVLGSTVPNSGTADRGMLAYLLGAAATGHFSPIAGAAAGAAALPYTPIGQKAMQAAIASRPETLRAVADILRRYSVPIGGAAAPALVNAVQP
jgi:hypothetical protein